MTAIGVPVVNFTLVDHIFFYIIRCDGPLNQCAIVLGVFVAFYDHWSLMTGGVNAHAVSECSLVVMFQVAFADVMTVGIPPN